MHTEIDLYKKEILELKQRCTHLSEEVQSTHRNVNTLKSQVDERDKHLRSYEHELQEVQADARQKEKLISEWKEQAET